MNGWKVASLAEPTLALERLADLGPLRGDWTRLAERAENVFGTWEWADAWNRHLGAGARLELGVARAADGGVVAILPLFEARRTPFRLLRFLGAGPSDQLGPICAPEDRWTAAKAMARFLASALRGGGIFIGERVLGTEGLGGQLGGVLLRSGPSPVLPVGGRSFDDFLGSRSRNFREQVRRRERRVAREHRLVYRLTEDPVQLEADMDTLIRLHYARWRDHESNALSGARASFHRDFSARALAHGWLRLWTMELDRRAVAAWYGFRFAGVETYYQAGRDPALDHLNVGFVLLSHAIRSAFDDGMREFRFGHGDEAYKNRFAELDPKLETIAVGVGLRGHVALAATRLAWRMPWRVKAIAWRLGTPSGT